jgi:hypothetical protein
MEGGIESWIEDHYYWGLCCYCYTFTWVWEGNGFLGEFFGFSDLYHLTCKSLLHPFILHLPSPSLRFLAMALGLDGGSRKISVS